MDSRLRGQVQPISAVIITGIVVSLVGVAYFWGVPMMQKQSSMSEYATTERFITDLKNSIEELARSGAGKTSLDLNGRAVTLLPYGDDGEGNNTLVMTFFMEQPLIFPNATLYMGATSFEDINYTGTYGEASPAIVKITSAPFGTQYILTAEIIYRELLRNDIPRKGFEIALCPARKSSCNTVMKGSNKISMSFDKNIVKPVEAANGGDLVLTYIEIELL